MGRARFVLLAAALLWPLSGLAQQAQDTVEPEPAMQAAATDAQPAAKGLGHRLLWYLPNRIFDVFDLVRLRAEAGPGFAVGARATRPLSVFMGGYSVVWAGLPGPRMEPKLPLPVGFDSAGGVQVSVIGGQPARYGRLEVGALLQVLLLGLDIGVDPGEALDLAAGLFMIDLRGDDF